MFVNIGTECEIYNAVHDQGPKGIPIKLGETFLQSHKKKRDE